MSKVYDIDVLIKYPKDIVSMQVNIVIVPARFNATINKYDMKNPERSMSVCSCSRLFSVNTK
ncbi:MAG: hypothetical protein IJ444_04330 [Kiritimatiellae bacterium]|nr:hypothetical protein [Kiritimatiellia bacterium]